MMKRIWQSRTSKPPASSTSFRSSRALVLTAICSAPMSGCSIRYSRASSACTTPGNRWSRPVRSTWIRQIGRMCMPVAASCRLACSSSFARCSTAANRVSFQLVLDRFLMCRSSLIISSACRSRPKISISTFASAVGVADSSTISDGLNPSSVAFALRLYALWPSSSTIIGRSSLRVLPSEVLICRPQKPPPSKVSRFGTRSSKARWPAASSSAGKKRSNPPLSRNIRSCSLVSRFADGSISSRMQRLSATSAGRKPLVFSRTIVRPADARSSCWRYGWSRSFRAMSVCR